MTGSEPMLFPLLIRIPGQINALMRSNTLLLLTPPEPVIQKTHTGLPQPLPEVARERRIACMYCISEERNPGRHVYFSHWNGQEFSKNLTKMYLFPFPLDRGTKQEKYSAEAAKNPGILTNVDSYIFKESHEKKRYQDLLQIFST